MFKAYYQLTKPGIIYGNALTAAAGFLFASKGHLYFWHLLALLAGTALVIASGCVFNNYLDRDIDRKMARTKKRSLVSGDISTHSALTYATVLGIAGFLALAIFTNTLTLVIGIIGFMDYVILYGIWKRRSIYGTLVGSVSGAMPIVAGYTAVTNQFDAGALLLFLVLVAWQMPHFFAIALYRRDDYAAASIPVWPVKQGARSTKIQMLFYVILFVLAVVALALWGYVGYAFLAIMVPLGLAWLWMCVQGLRAADDKKWGRQMFFFSLKIIMALSIMLPVGAVLP